MWIRRACSSRGNKKGRLAETHIKYLLKSMSTIIAIKYNNHLFMWCDGRISDSGTITAEESPKILPFRDYLLGFAWFSSIAQTVELLHSEIVIDKEVTIHELKEYIVQLILSHGLKEQLKETSILFWTKQHLFIYEGTDGSFTECQHYASIWTWWAFVYWYFHAYKDFWWEGWEKQLVKIGGQEMISRWIHVASSCDIYTNTKVFSFSL